MYLQGAWKRSGRCQNSSSQDSSSQDRSGQDRSSQDRSSQDRSSRDRWSQARSSQDSLIQDRSSQDWSCQDRSSKDRASQDRSSQKRSGQDRSCQDMTNQVRSKKFYGKKKLTCLNDQALIAWFISSTATASCLLLAAYCLKYCATAVSKHFSEAVWNSEAAQQRNCFFENNMVPKNVLS